MQKETVTREQRMDIRSPKTIDPSGQEQRALSKEQRSEAAKADTCRCKETSTMTPRELLRLMMTDLVFWTKSKKK